MEKRPKCPGISLFQPNCEKCAASIDLRVREITSCDSCCRSLAAVPEATAGAWQAIDAVVETLPDVRRGDMWAHRGFGPSGLAPDRLSLSGARNWQLPDL